jgi:hypothetical protein
MSERGDKALKAAHDYWQHMHGRPDPKPQNDYEEMCLKVVTAGSMVHDLLRMIQRVSGSDE